MKLNKRLLRMFRSFKKSPKGHLISNPDRLIFSGISITKQTAEILQVVQGDLFFTRKSLKHLAEKPFGKTMLEAFLKIIHKPEKIHRGKIRQRFLLSKVIKGEGDREHAVSLEVMKNDNALVVTIFKTDHGYLESFEILWRAGAL